MNSGSIIEKLNIDARKLDAKKQQTSYKIQFVSSYMEIWLYVNTNRDNIKNVVFIDSMCNAGVYADGDFGTSTQVLSLFKEAARLNPKKSFILILNDYDKDRMDICSKIVNEILVEEPVSTKNLVVYVSNQDVNSFLGDLEAFDKFIKQDAATVLFVDPYDFVTVDTQTLRRFIERYYCEVIYNFFSSDFIRNKGTDRIKEYLGVGDFKTIEDAESMLLSELKVGKMRFTFSYVFKNVHNTELYRILFFTPSMTGLEKLKEALWGTFKGKPFHRNTAEGNAAQLSFFTETDEKQLQIDYYASTAKEQLLHYYEGKTVPYPFIKSYLLQNTMMIDSQIIKHVIKPLIAERKLIKCGLTERSHNYKEDSYTFKKEPGQ